MRNILSVIATVLTACTMLAAAPASAAGDLDWTFGAGTGKVWTAIGLSDDRGYAIALQPDGKIVVAGQCANGGNFDFCLVRYQASGTLDSSFGSGGGVISAVGSADDVGLAITLQPDGKIIVAGYCSNGSNDDFCLARYQANGALDASFGSGGKVITPIGSADDRGQAIALQPDGKIVVAGKCSNGSNWDFCLARYQANGALDGGFGSGGTVITDITSDNDRGNAITLQPDGKIVVAGTCDPFLSDFCLTRYQADGALDVGFGLSGKVTSAIGSAGDFGQAIALQPDGKIVVAGYCANGSNDDFCLARYNGGPFDARNCSMDIDGDGAVLSTTDALLLARASLGMTGNAVINGISFASHATRKTWPTIRDYLVRQCGMTLVP